MHVQLTYIVRVGIRTSESAKIGQVKAISLSHVPLLDFFLLCFRERCLFVHTS